MLGFLLLAQLYTNVARCAAIRKNPMQGISMELPAMVTCKGWGTMDIGSGMRHIVSFPMITEHWTSGISLHVVRKGCKTPRLDSCHVCNLLGGRPSNQAQHLIWHKPTPLLLWPPKEIEEFKHKMSTLQHGGSIRWGYKWDWKTKDANQSWWQQAGRGGQCWKAPFPVTVTFKSFGRILA